MKSWFFICDKLLNNSKKRLPASCRKDLIIWRIFNISTFIKETKNIILYIARKHCWIILNRNIAMVLQWTNDHHWLRMNDDTVQTPQAPISQTNIFSICQQCLLPSPYHSLPLFTHSPGAETFIYSFVNSDRDSPNAFFGTFPLCHCCNLVI